MKSIHTLKGGPRGPRPRFLFDATHGYTYSTNESGALIHHLLAAGQSVAEIAAALARRFEVDLQIARLDVDDFIRQLREAGLQ